MSLLMITHAIILWSLSQRRGSQAIAMGCEPSTGQSHLFLYFMFFFFTTHSGSLQSVQSGPTNALAAS